MPRATPAVPGGRTARWSAILDLLATDGRLSVSQAAGRLAVSEATVRRDFAALSKRGLVTRQHGEIVAGSVAYELPFRYRSGLAEDEVVRVARRAAALIAPGHSVAVNGGTTTTATIREVTRRSDLVARESQITIVTNALNVAAETVLRPHVRCVSLGGLAREESYELTGPLTMLALEQLWFDTAVVGVDGLSAAAGATCRYEDEAAVVRTMISRAQRTIVVAAAAKLGARSFARIADAVAISDVVTTAGPENPHVHALAEVGVRIWHA